MANIDNINIILANELVNGYNSSEPLEEDILNRPIKDLITLFESGQFDGFINKTNIPLTDNNDFEATVVTGDFVTLNETSGKYEKTIYTDPVCHGSADLTNVIVQTGGMYSNGDTFVKGKDYYISLTIPGSIVVVGDADASDFKVGTAISTSVILLSLGNISNAQTLGGNPSSYFAPAADLTALEDEVASHAPINTGDIIVRPVNSIPTGFLECDGSAIDRTAYADLFAVIGETYGIGDGSTTFELPDLRGEFIRGWDNGRGVDVGRTVGSSQLDAFQGHTFNIAGGAGLGADGLAVGSGSTTVARYTDLAALAYIDTDGSNGTPRITNETRPRNIAMMYCIKY